MKKRLPQKVKNILGYLEFPQNGEWRWVEADELKWDLVNESKHFQVWHNAITGANFLLEKKTGRVFRGIYNYGFFNLDHPEVLELSELAEAENVFDDKTAINGWTYDACINAEEKADAPPFGRVHWYWDLNEMEAPKEG